MAVECSPSNTVRRDRPILDPGHEPAPARAKRADLQTGPGRAIKKGARR
jgi:hypothetical protein